MPKAASKSKSSGPQPATRSAPYPLPKPKANDTSTLTEKSAASINTATKQTSPSSPSSPSKSTPQSFLDLELSGESDHSVPVYDTCTVIRTKISNLIKKDQKPENAIPNESIKNGQPKHWNVRAFVEALGDGASKKMYRTFMRKSGVMAGGESEIFYRAYCFFEKKRIWEGKGKSVARKNAEAEHPHGLKLFDPTKPRSLIMRPGEKLGRDVPEVFSAGGPCANCGKHTSNPPAS